MLTTIIPIVETQKDAMFFTTLAAMLRDPENHKDRLKGMDESKRLLYALVNCS